MKVLLDSNVPHDLRLYLKHHDAFTAAYMGWANLSNGELLKAAEDAGFQVLVTADKTLHYEQNLSGIKLAIVSLSANSWPVIEPSVPKIVAAIDMAEEGSFAQVNCGAFTRRRDRSGPAPS